MASAAAASLSGDSSVALGSPAGASDQPPVVDIQFTPLTTPGNRHPSRQMLPLPIRTPPRTPVRELAKAQRHREYYFDDGNVVLQVEDISYKLHRSLLERHSPFFREMFTMPQPLGSTEGLSDDNPILLSGIEAINFTRLLWLIYPPVLASCKVTTVDEWMSIFEQADRWQMDGLRERALNELRSLYIDPIRKVLFWTRYNLPASELVSSYMDIILRPQSLSIGEAQVIGLERFTKIAQARDMAHAAGLGRRSGGYSVKTDRVAADIIQRVFGLSLGPASPIQSS